MGEWIACQARQELRDQSVGRLVRQVGAYGARAQDVAHGAEVWSFSAPAGPAPSDAAP